MDHPSHMSMRDFECIKELGAGSFGKVKLVKKKGSDNLFALKTVSICRLSQKDKDAALN
jgi:serine/threonine protein kinase